MFFTILGLVFYSLIALSLVFGVIGLFWYLSWVLVFNREPRIQKLIREFMK